MVGILVDFLLKPSFGGVFWVVGFNWSILVLNWKLCRPVLFYRHFLKVHLGLNFWQQGLHFRAPRLELYKAWQ